MVDKNSSFQIEVRAESGLDFTAFYKRRGHDAIFVPGGVNSANSANTIQL